MVWSRKGTSPVKITNEFANLTVLVIEAAQTYGITIIKYDRKLLTLRIL
jgi:hypothetical protein